MVRELLEHGADPNAVRNDDFTALMLAAFSGYQEIVRILVEHGANTDAATRFGTTAQMWAASRTFKDVVHYLEHPERIQEATKVAPVANNYAELPQAATDLQVDDNESYEALPDSSAGWVAETNALPELDTTPLTSVVQNCNDSAKTKESSQLATQQLWRIAETEDIKRVESLLARGAEINASNAHGMTALMRAAASGRIRMVRELLEHGADPNAVRNDDFTALMLAAFSGHQEIVRTLVEHGAKTDAATRFGTTAQMLAASRDVVHYFEPPGLIQEAAKVAPVANNATDLQVDDNESYEALPDSSAGWVAATNAIPELDTTPLTNVVQNYNDLTDVAEPLNDQVLPLWTLARLQTFSRKARVYVLTTLLFSIAVFAHLTLDRKQRVVQLAPHVHPPAVIDESAVPITAKKDSLSKSIEEKATASPDPLVSNNAETVNSKEASTLKAANTGIRIVTVVDSDRRKPSEKRPASVTQSLPTPEHTEDVAASTTFKPAPISIAKPPSAVSREPAPEKYSTSPPTQLVSGSKGAAPSGKVIQWP
jgi:ankyrin repeat protein